jgi:hypothetical protein
MSQLYTKNFVDVSKFVIWGDATGDDNSKRPRMVFSFRDGNPRLTVYTGVTGPEGVIAFPSDFPTMVTIINLIKDIANGEPGQKVSVDSATNIYENNKPTNKKKVVSTLYVGKSKEGVVYLSLISENKPKLVFPFKPSAYHAFRDADKNEFPVAKISAKMATGVADVILNLISDVLIKYTEEEYQTSRKPTRVKNNDRDSSGGTEVVQSIDDLGI